MDPSDFRVLPSVLHSKELRIPVFSSKGIYPQTIASGVYKSRADNGEAT